MAKQIRIGDVAKLLVLFSIASIATLFSKDYWDSKKFTDWNEPECMALLSDSPWARTQNVPGNYTTATPRVMDTGANKTANSGGSLVGTQGLGGTETVPFFMRWYSSVKIRQALGRLGQIRAKYSDEQINQALAAPMPDCLLGVIGPSMAVFDGATFETLKPKTFLLSKKDKSKKIELKAYAPPKDRPDRVAMFTFPRTIDGKPAIDLTDDEIVFVTEVGKLKIRAVFKVSRMIVDGNPDI